MYQLYRGFNLVKKGPKNSGMGKPPPLFRAMPERNRAFTYEVFPKSKWISEGSKRGEKRQSESTYVELKQTPSSSILSATHLELLYFNTWGEGGGYKDKYWTNIGQNPLQ